MSIDSKDIKYWKQAVSLFLFFGSATITAWVLSVVIPTYHDPLVYRWTDDNQEEHCEVYSPDTDTTFLCDSGKFTAEELSQYRVVYTEPYILKFVGNSEDVPTD